MTFCSSCSTKTVDGASFCHQCSFSFASADTSDVHVPRPDITSPPTATVKGIRSKISRLPSGTGPPILTFTEFRSIKENDRQKHFKSKVSESEKAMKAKKQ